MKFTLGEWRRKPGVTVYHCEQIRQTRLSADGTELYLFTVPYREDRRSMDGPALELDRKSVV